MATLTPHQMAGADHAGTGIIVNLLMKADFYDVALRDFGLVLAALTLTRLATAFPPRHARS